MPITMPVDDRRTKSETPYAHSTDAETAKRRLAALSRVTRETVNKAFLGIASESELEAKAAVDKYIATRMREDGFSRRIIPPVQITNDVLDRQVDTDRPVRVVE